MKKILKITLLWLIFVMLFSCLNREKNLQKTNISTEIKTEATAKIKKDSIAKISEKILENKVWTNSVQNTESKKDETKDVQIIREYYENGNLKSEINKSFSQLSEATKYAIAEMREELSKQKDISRFWKSSSDNYYQLLQQEKIKNKTKDLSVKKEQTFTWQMFFVGMFFGWLFLPAIFRWIKSWLLRFQPYLQFIQWIKNLRK